MSGNIRSFETCKGPHADVVKLRQQKGIDEMAAIDSELRIIDSLFGDLQPRRPRAKKTATASPVEFGFQLFRARDKIGEMNTKQIMTFNYIRIAFFDECGKSPQRVPFGFFYVLRTDDD